jgi:hypothetical protein
MSAEGAPRFLPALRASSLGMTASPPSRAGLLTIGPSDLSSQVIRRRITMEAIHLLRDNP